MGDASGSPKLFLRPSWREVEEGLVLIPGAVVALSGSVFVAILLDWQGFR